MIGGGPGLTRAAARGAASHETRGKMRQPELSFHIAREAGLEMVFSRGSALRYPEHTHVAACTLTLVRRGVVCLRRGRTECVYPRGSVYAVARHEPHSPAYSDGFDCVSLCIDLRRCAALRREALERVCAEYCGLLREKGLLRPEDAGALLTELDALLPETGMPVRDGRPPLHPAVSASLRRFELPEEEGADADPAADALSPFHFIRRFRRELGLTPHKYLVQSRVRAARHLLAHAPSIADLAARLGFCDQSHLDRCFKRALGVSPKAYREACVFWENWG